jgi:NSS family neurotransmitter:Na+ symporter
LSSSISLIEPGVAWLIESLKIKRITATILLGFVAWFIGLLVHCHSIFCLSLQFLEETFLMLLIS